MSTPSSISRRMRDAIHAHGRGDYEGALVHFFPALDKAAKRRRPKVGVGQRIRGFLADEEGLISALANRELFPKHQRRRRQFPGRDIPFWPNVDCSRRRARPASQDLLGRKPSDRAGLVPSALLHHCNVHSGDGRARVRHGEDRRGRRSRLAGIQVETERSMGCS
jgi:hypothetical protein